MSYLRGAYGMHFQTKKIKPKKAEKMTGLGCQQPSPLLEGKEIVIFRVCLVHANIHLNLFFMQENIKYSHENSTLRVQIPRLRGQLDFRVAPSGQPASVSLFLNAGYLL